MPRAQHEVGERVTVTVKTYAECNFWVNSKRVVPVSAPDFNETLRNDRMADYPIEQLRFFTRKQAVTSDGETLSGEKNYLGGIHYVGCTVYTVDQVKANIEAGLPEFKAIVEICERDRVAHVIYDSDGWFRPFNDEDVLVPVDAKRRD